MEQLLAKPGCRARSIHQVAVLTRVQLVRAMVFSVVMFGCESWTIKKAEH